MLPSGFELVLKVIGGLVILKFGYTAIKGIFARLIRPGKNLKKYGSWGEYVYTLYRCKLALVIVSTPIVYSI